MDALLVLVLRPNQKLEPSHVFKSGKPNGNGNETGGKAVPWVTSMVQPSTVADEVPINLFTWALASKQAAMR